MDLWAEAAPCLRVCYFCPAVLVASVMLANTLANMCGAGLGGAVRSSSVDSLLRTLGLPPGQVEQYAKYLATELPHLNDLVTSS